MGMRHFDEGAKWSNVATVPQSATWPFPRGADNTDSIVIGHLYPREIVRGGDKVSPSVA